MTILDRIVEDTRALVAERRRRVSIARLEDRPAFAEAARPFAEALRQEALTVIAEVKRASPSQGIIRSRFDPPGHAAAYAEAGAAAISVLTEPTHFKGDLAHLEAVRDAVDLPLLRKDFIVDPYQVVEAKAYGADAVLLIAAVLDRSQLRDLLDAAADLGLETLVEVYALGELDRIDFDAVRVLGVNNRDLHTFEVDVDHSLRVFAHAPDTVVRVSESGLRTADDLAHLRRHGVDAVLIGETFMRAEDPGRALAELRTALAERLAADA